MTKPNFTHIVVLLDRSGSMGRVQADTIGGFNTFIEEQKKVPGEATITLVQFNDTAETTYSNVPLAHVATLTEETYKPSGWTALNDAFVKTIDDVGVYLSSKPEHERPSKVIFLVMTDGEENKSVKFAGLVGRNKLAEIVKHQSTKYAWTFSFIGANLDAFATGSSYGIDTSFIINYQSTPIGTHNAFKSLSRGTAASRVSAVYGNSVDKFFENERNTNSVDALHLDTADIGDVVKKYTPVDATKTAVDVGSVIGIPVDITKTETTK